MSFATRDYQRSRVYAWEDTVIKPRDQSEVPFDSIQTIVDYVWGELGLLYPPKVEPFPKNVKRRVGDANRLKIRFHEDRTTPTWIILHEIAHALTRTSDDEGDQHGPTYVGVYAKLLDRFLHVPMPLILYTLKQARVDIDLQAKPIFLD